MTKMPVSHVASPRALRELCGFGLVAALLMLLASGKAVLHDTMDPDFFWHIRVAEQLQSQGIHAIVDRLSYSSLKTPWSPYSWLGELGMKWIWDHGGLRGAIAAQALLEALFVLLVLLCAMQETTAPRNDDDAPAPLIPRLVATTLTLILALPYLSFRPVLLAIDVLALCTLLLLRDRRLGQRSRMVWLVPALTALTVNLHIFALFVPLWVAALLVGAWIERDRRSLRRYGWLLLFCALGCCCTPLFVGTIATVWQYTMSNPLTSHAFINELEPMYRGTTHQVTLAIVLLLVGCAMIRKRNGAGEWLWLGGMLLLWIKCGRAAPILAPLLACAFVQAFGWMSDRALGARWICTCAAMVLLVGTLRVLLSLPDNTHAEAWLNRRGPDLPGYPTAAAEFVQAKIKPSSRRLINEFGWGGYLAWKLQQYQVFVDGRTQLFSPEFWHAAYLDDPHQTTRLLASANADAAILPVGASRFRESLQSLGWKRAFHDERAEVFVPPSSVASGND